MAKLKIESKALRITFIIVGLIIMAGIWLTGFSVVHWLLYVPAVALILAGITGLCPMLFINKTITREN